MKKEKKVDSWGVSVINRSQTRVTRHRESDKWDADDTSTSNDIQGIEVVEGWGDVSLGFEPKVGVDYFLLYAEYSTGDSFHHESGRIEYIALYTTFEDAKKNRDILEEHYSKQDRYENRYDYKGIEIFSYEGIPYKYNPSYYGYFESLQSLRITDVRRKYA